MGVLSVWSRKGDHLLFYRENHQNTVDYYIYMQQA